MTTSYIENTPCSPVEAPNAVWRWIGLLTLGFAVGYLTFGDPMEGGLNLSPTVSNVGPAVIEDWHGNVRRSVPSF